MATVAIALFATKMYQLISGGPLFNKEGDGTEDE